MAGETKNRADIANMLSEQIFSVFGWKQSSGPTDENFPCIDKEAHHCHQHPTDIVFYYDDPYIDETIYIQTDLKSYAKNSINSSDFGPSILSLGKQVECANISDVWQSRYINTRGNFKISGCLFIFNHDNEYTNEIVKSIDGISEEIIEQIPPNKEIHIITPERVRLLNTIAHDIRSLYYKQQTKQHYFYYPNLVRKASRISASSKCARIQTLLGPIIPTIICNNQSQKKLIIYYIKNGTTEGEFTYLIDYILHFQQEQVFEKIEVRLVDSDKNAIAFFNAAFQKLCEKDSLTEEKLKNVHASRVNNVTPIFSEIDLGMSPREK
jgi:hypothetical protein